MAAKTKKKTMSMVPQAKESARNVWLAGVGALALAEDEGGKLFDQLVKRGAAFESKNRKRLGTMVDNVKDLRGDVSDVFGKVVSPVNTAVEKAMHKLGVPTRKEIATLTKRVEELTKAVEKSRAKPRRPASRARTEAAVG
ncbi:MAG: phasin family protein [Gemmatimonadota bacterium]|nr:phasin family protein [Gemmatimonadota bacterium]MDH4352149.1 phasin family protein [Gemmatimonadota bacterium]MDH5196626.1 phasin family protein [Gemmatimonadota bacterium]